MKRTLFDKLGDFVLGKGFYIVLFLCVATIGISGYYLVQAVTADPAGELEPVTANPTVELPAQPAPSQETEEKKPTAGENKTQAEQASAAASPAPQQSAPQQEKPRTAESAPAAATPKAPAVYTWPVKGKILRGHSVETLAYDQTMGDWRTHSGIDIAAEEGLKVLCVSDGTVAEVRKDDLMGTTVVVDHGDGLKSTYSNLAEAVTVSVGQEVDTGTVLGTVGKTAIAEGSLESHLHLAMEKDGQAVDPVSYLPK